MNRIRPYTATQLALALGLAGFLADTMPTASPTTAKFRCGRLAVVAQAS
jgi:hypothetical protein